MSEDGYAISAVGPDELVVAGQVGDPNNGPSLARGVRVKLNSFGVVAGFNFPSGDLGTAEGSTRFRAVTPIGDSGRLLSWGPGPPATAGTPNIAFARVAEGDLSKTESAGTAGDAAADLLAAGTSPKGQVLVGGYATDDKGQKIGWLEFFGGGALQTVPTAVTEGRRVNPNRSLPPLFKSLTRMGSTYQLPDNALSSTTGFYLSALPNGLPVDIALTPALPVVLRARLIAAVGDVDLALFDSDGHLVDFSNYRGGAPQVLVAQLQPGKYVLSLLPDSDAKNIEIDVGRANALDVATIASITSVLSPDEREKLADRLALEGESRPSEPSIAFGGETLLSLLAAKDGGASISSRVLEELPRDLLFGTR